MDFACQQGDGMRLEIFCNPNSAADAFSAAALVTAEAPGMRGVIEVPISALKADLETYAVALKAQPDPQQ